QLYDDGNAGLGGPTIIRPEETIGGQEWSLDVTHLGSVGQTVSSSNTVTIDAPLFEFVQTEQTQAESLASPTIEVSLSVPDATGSNTVNYTMTGTAVEGKDYTLANGTLTFVANDTSETIPLTIIDDALMENLETIIFTLTSPTGNAVLGSDIVHTYTITDNETMTVELNDGDTSVTTFSSIVPSI